MLLHLTLDCKCSFCKNTGYEKPWRLYTKYLQRHLTNDIITDSDYWGLDWLEKTENIPYKNTPEIALAVASGQTEFGLLPIAGAGKLAEAGKVKIIGITGDRTLPAFPAVPVINIIKIQSGWYFTLPPNTPRDIVDWYQREFNRAIRSDEYRQWAESMYITVDENKLDPAGVKKYAEFLRKTFMPVASQIKKP